MPKRCVLGCRYKRGYKYHQFPHAERNPEMFKAWVHIAGGKLETTADVEFYKRKVICDIHFDSSCKNRNSRLNAIAVPTLHLPAQIARETSTKEASATVPCDGNSQTTDTANLSSNETTTIEKQTSITTVSEENPELAVVSTAVANTTTLCVTAAPSTTTRRWLPPAPETIDYVDDGASIVEEPMFEFEPTIVDEELSIRNAVSPRFCDLTEEPSAKMKCVRPVMRSELCAEREHSTHDTTRHMVNDTARHTADDTTRHITKDTTHAPYVAGDTCTASTGIPKHTTVASKENDNYKKYWQSALSHIVHSTQFCGVCLSTDVDVHSVWEHFEIVVCERTHCTSLVDILRVVFTETDNLLSNQQICNNCTNKLIQSYMFIQQARETSRILNCQVNDLYYKSCYLLNNILQENHQNQPEVKNALISLESYDNVERSYNIYTTEQVKKVEKKPEQPKMKRKFKCLRCNLYLPSYKAWMIHEISTHHRSKKYTTQVESVKTSRLLRRICKLCNQIIENGKITEHMKKHHGQASHLCSICNIRFSSFKDFVNHKQEWHYGEVSKCLTCLKSYSEVELEQHQCRFGCNSCSEVPCIHHKYLMCYREQILHGAHKAKCLDCQYVCRSKEALLKHANLCHLKRRPKIS